MKEDERLYMIYVDTRDGLEYVDDRIAKTPQKALEKSVEDGVAHRGDRFTVIADSNMNDVVVR